MNPDMNALDGKVPESASPDAVDTVFEWMVTIAQAVGQAKRLAILWALEAGDASVKALQGQVGLSKSSVHRHLTVLAGAGLVSEVVLGFVKGPRRGYQLSACGQQLLAVLKGLHEYQSVPEHPIPERDTPVCKEPVSAVGQIPVRRDYLCQLVVQVAEFYQWQLIHDLLDVKRFRVAMHRLHTLAKDMHIDLDALLEPEAEEKQSDPSGRRQRR